MNIGANEGASDKESRIVFFHILSFFFVSSQISIIYPYMHMSMIVAGQGQKVHFFRVGYNWEVFQGCFGGISYIFCVFIRTSSTANSRGVAG